MHLANFVGLPFCGSRDRDTATYDARRVKCKKCMRIIERSVKNEQRAERRQEAR